MPKLAAQPGIHPSVTSYTSAGLDPSYIVLVDSGMPRSLTRSPFVAGWFWAVILTHPVHRQGALGFGVVLFKAGGCRQGLCPKQTGMAWAQNVTAQTTGPEYAICHAAFCTMNFVMPSACTYSWFPPLYFDCALHLINQGLHHSGVKTDVL